MGEIVFRTLPVFENDRRPHGHGWDRQYREHGPLRPGDFGINPEVLKVFIRNLFQACPDVCRGELMLHLLAFLEQDLGECCRFLEIDLELLLPTMGADTLLFDIFFREDIPCQVILSPDYLLDLFR